MMKRAKGLCRCCGKAFEADSRNAGRQKYCSAPDCRRASKTASQHLWLSKRENWDYHSGPAAVARVRGWQNAHPEYRERQRTQRAAALQDSCPAQAPELTEELAIAPNPEAIETPALQDCIMLQPLVVIGLIAHFFNLTLQDDIANTSRSLQKLGEDIVANGRGTDGYAKAGHLSRAPAAGAGAIQLGGSAPGAG